MEQPTAPDKQIQVLSDLLIKYTNMEEVEFSFGGEPLSTVETFSYFGGLSLFIIEAKEIYEKVYNKLYSIEELMETITTEKNRAKRPSLTEDQKSADLDYLSKQPKNKVFPIDFFEQEDETYFGFIPRTSLEIPASFGVLSHVTQYTLEEYIQFYKKKKLLLENGTIKAQQGDELLLKNGTIPLDPLYEKMVEKINNQQILLRQKSQLAQLNEIFGNNKETAREG